MVSDFIDLMYSPKGDLRPTSQQILKMLEENNVVDKGEIDTWERESFICMNKDTEIYGEFFPMKDSNVCAILVHGYAQNRYIMIPQQKIFREFGYNTLLFDQRAFGESKEKYCTFGVWEAEDVACLVKWVKEKMGSDSKIIVLGVSMGAATTINSIKYSKDIDCVIEDSGYTDIMENVESLYLNLNGNGTTKNIKETFLKKAEKIGIKMDNNKPIEVLKNTNIPVCIIHGSDDSVIDKRNAEQFAQAAKSSICMVEIFEKKEHALCVEDKNKYKCLLQKFLKKVL